MGKIAEEGREVIKKGDRKFSKVEQQFYGKSKKNEKKSSKNLIDTINVKNISKKYTN